MDTGIVSISSGLFRTLLIGTYEQCVYTHITVITVIFMVYQRYRQIILLCTYLDTRWFTVLTVAVRYNYTHEERCGGRSIQNKNTPLQQNIPCD